MIPEEESIDNAFAKFNTIITSLKALDEGFSSKNCVRKFLRALHQIGWREKSQDVSCEDSFKLRCEDEEFAMAVKDSRNLQETRKIYVVIQITSLENIHSRQRIMIKEHLFEEDEVTMEKMKWKRLKIKLVL
ncbi:hypothetical protein Tco_0351202 [Tanacetum coccineum]